MTQLAARRRDFIVRGAESVVTTLLAALAAVLCVTEMVIAVVIINDHQSALVVRAVAIAYLPSSLVIPVLIGMMRYRRTADEPLGAFRAGVYTSLTISVVLIPFALAAFSM